MRRAWLVVRPAGRRPGGDIEQARESAAVLRSHDWDARSVDASRCQPGDGDVVVLHNLQRCLDWGELPERSRAVGARLLVAPIFHDTTRYHAHGRQGGAALVARAMPDPDRFAALRWGSRDWRPRARQVLASTDRLLPAHADEAAALQAALGCALPPAAVVPVAVPETLPPPSALPPLPPRFALCVGRIEPLKNTAAVVDACAALGVPLVLVGACPRRHWAYGLAVLRRLRGRWLGTLPPEQVRGVMARAHVHVLASWAELLGRVSLEAALGGAAVISTTEGLATRVFEGLGAEDGFRTAEPGDRAALRRSLQEAWSRPRPGPALAERVRRGNTWRTAGPALAAALDAEP